MAGCPSCKRGVLVLRTSHYGEFRACSNFPACSYKPKKRWNAPFPATKNGAKVGQVARRASAAGGSHRQVSQCHVRTGRMPGPPRIACRGYTDRHLAAYRSCAFFSSACCPCLAFASRTSTCSARPWRIEKRRIRGGEEISGARRFRKTLGRLRRVGSSARTVTHCRALQQRLTIGCRP
jgi:hypothetical protein